MGRSFISHLLLLLPLTPSFSFFSPLLPSSPLKVIIISSYIIKVDKSAAKGAKEILYKTETSPNIM